MKHEKEQRRPGPGPFVDYFPEFDPALLAEIDAELEAERNDPNFKPPQIAWRDDPDPFGTNWEWLYECPKPSASDDRGNGTA